MFNLFLLFAGEAGEAHAGQLGQRIGCMIRIEYGRESQLADSMATVVREEDDTCLIARVNPAALSPLTRCTVPVLRTHDFP